MQKWPEGGISRGWLSPDWSQLKDAFLEPRQGQLLAHLSRAA
ncbi:hypothetical protein [Caulobacter vibrioides]|uniref:Uncharacterized protein n=1 Tax=Caulobacter vibrioides (strain NA1000 / CB15N) TaxID=565050 RepID=A0A0H3CBJ6_CAUVN|nr:hypothetical protein [Caulobacter vibrioides]YP_002518196.1 hypothetical protein CCNA_02823 [Caulobacter vibrioides NA1000]ACL96288.1 hypothetical protein CCNA_02823 [Caulobacter vibrioides NA1000]QXZ51093.1 hypothetical protein KZH45_14540 [Caulobacter vibrioides]